MVSSFGSESVDRGLLAYSEFESFRDHNESSLEISADRQQSFPDGSPILESSSQDMISKGSVASRLVAEITRHPWSHPPLAVKLFTQRSRPQQAGELPDQRSQLHGF